MISGIFLLLGSNLGDRHKNLQTARELIEAQIGPVVKSSGTYQTAAWGNTNQPAFYNVVLEVSTTDSPEELLTHALAIEQQLGRQRLEHWGPRVIDIDILLFGDKIVQTEHLTIPHPQMTNRRFTLMPLAEIAGEVMHPVRKKNIQELLLLCPDTLEVVRIA
jgi:2-amino-4-hydroxy-6-hydroxymethyldihydropteridine diphosphokinase